MAKYCAHPFVALVCESCKLPRCHQDWRTPGIRRQEEIAMREEKMEETLERADSFIEISATSDAQKPTVIIGVAADNSTQTEVTKYQDLQQLTEALVKLGEDRRTVGNDLERIYTSYATVEGVAMAGESACYRPNITIAQARDFGWKD
jgi:hypothetical protein